MSKKFISVLQKLGKDTPAKVYFTGGFVRDLLRKKEPNSIDIVIADYPMEDLVKFLKKYGKVKYNDSLYHMMTYSINGEEINISIPRRGKKRAHFYTIKDDARYRDFTINAMYLPIDRRSKKHIIDFYDGINDIKDHKIKAVGNPRQVIQADPLRMIRAVSFAAQLGYRIDVKLFNEIRNRDISANIMEKLDADLIRDEFIKIILSKKPSKYIKTLSDLSLLRYVMPELDMCMGLRQNKEYHKHDVFTHSILACDNTDADIVLRLSALLHDIGKLQTYNEDNTGGKVTFYSHEVVSAKLSKRILKRLNFDKEIIAKVVELTYLHMYNYEPDKWSDGAVRRFIKKAGITKENIDHLDTFPLFLVRRADRLANGYTSKEVSHRQELFQKHIKDIFEKSNVFTVNDLAIDGHTLMKEFHLKEGPTVGHILNFLLSIVIDDQKLNTREILIEKTSDYLSAVLK